MALAGAPQARLWASSLGGILSVISQTARQQAASIPQAAAQAQQPQRSYITVDVLNGNVDKAWRSLNRQVQEEGFLETAKAQQVFLKPSERRKLDKRASQQKLRQQEFREMLRWAMKRKSRGF